jgi:predicted phosphohydrolase
MEKFGNNWKDHFEKIRTNWHDAVRESDIVLIPGDISWALRYDEALADIEFIGRLPGKKVIVKGNHDFWWTGITRMRKEAPKDVYYIQNDCIEFENLIISGTRLWNYPFIRWHNFTQEFDFERAEINNQVGDKCVYNHEKIRLREMERLKLCLAKMQISDGQLRIFMTHFPPIGQDLEGNIVTKLFVENDVDVCIFGHLHSVPNEKNVDTEINGVKYIFVSCDYLNFKPKLILEF